jgi:hypothetical protein
MALAGKWLRPGQQICHQYINHPGFALLLIAIAIIQNSESHESPVNIYDLVNADGSSAGTEVIIKMPVMYD